MPSYRLANGKTASDIRYDTPAVLRKQRRKLANSESASGRREQRSKKSQGATRTLVTRSDIGTANGRIGAPAAERAPHGAVNTRSSVTDRNPDGSRYRVGAAPTAPMTFVATDRKDSFDSERDASAGERAYYNAERCDKLHRDQLLRSNPDWSL